MEEAILDLTDENIYYVRTSDNKKLFVAKVSGIEGKLECYEWMYRNCSVYFKPQTGNSVAEQR